MNTGELGGARPSHPLRGRTGRWRRFVAEITAYDDQSATPAPSDLAVAQSGDESQSDDLVLVPLPKGRNEALALGTDATLDAFESSGLGRRSTVGSGGPLPQVVRQGIGAGGQAVTKLADTQIDAGRIVALSDETMKELAAKKAAYDKAGNMLGVVRGSKGGFRHVMRLDRAGAKAVTVSNAATVVDAGSTQSATRARRGAPHRDPPDPRQPVAANDRERLAKVVASNRELLKIADRIRTPWRDDRR